MKNLLAAILILLALNTQAQEKKEYVTKGIKAFADATVGFGDDVTAYSSVMVGYQMNRILFIGAGAAGGFIEKPDINSLDYVAYFPMFGCLRFDILDKMVSPYIDIRGGKIYAENYKAYGSASAGCRVKLGKLSLCLSEGIDFCTCNYNWGSYNYSKHQYDSEYENDVVISIIGRFTIGFDI